MDNIANAVAAFFGLTGPSVQPQRHDDGALRLERLECPRPFEAALQNLRNSGYRVEPAEGGVGLWNVGGQRDLTEAQVLSLFMNRPHPA